MSSMWFDFGNQHYTVKLWQINPDKAKEGFRVVGQKHGDSGIGDLMDSMGLGFLAEQVRTFAIIRIAYLRKHCLTLSFQIC